MSEKFIQPIPGCRVKSEPLQLNCKRYAETLGFQLDVLFGLGFVEYQRAFMIADAA